MTEREAFSASVSTGSGPSGSGPAGDSLQPELADVFRLGRRLVAARDTGRAERILGEIRQLAVEQNVYRGQVITFSSEMFGHGRGALLTFLDRSPRLGRRGLYRTGASITRDRTPSPRAKPQAGRPAAHFRDRRAGTLAAEGACATP